MTAFPLKPAHMANQKDWKNRRGFWRQNFNNSKPIFLVPCLHLLLSHTLMTLKGLANEGCWPNCARKGIGKHIYILSQVQDHPIHALNVPLKKFPETFSTIYSIWWENKAKWKILRWSNSFKLKGQDPDKYSLMARPFSSWGTGPDDLL